MQCSNNLKQLGLAIANYESQHGVLPIGAIYGGPTDLEHTALALLLPFMEQVNTWQMYNFSLRSYQNGPALQTQISAYQCPSDNAAGRSAYHSLDKFYYARSNVAVCFGAGTMENSTPGTIGAFGKDVAHRMADITDGTSNTVAGSEVLTGQSDLFAASLNWQWDLRGVWGSCMIGSFAYSHLNTPNSSQGDAMWANPGQDIECTPGDGMPCDNTHGTNYDQFQAAARSRHPGGVNVVFIDGHGTFISNTISRDPWQRLGAIADGLMIPTDY